MMTRTRSTDIGTSNGKRCRGVTSSTVEITLMVFDHSMQVFPTVSGFRGCWMQTLCMAQQYLHASDFSVMCQRTCAAQRLSSLASSRAPPTCCSMSVAIRRSLRREWSRVLR